MSILRRRKEIKKFKKGYTDKNNGDLTEFNSEKQEFYYDKTSKKILNKYDDADNPIFPEGIKKRNLGANWK